MASKQPLRKYDLDDPVIKQLQDWEPEPFDPEQDILDDFTVILFGRRIGKSYFTRWLLYKILHRLPFGVCITN